MTTDVSGLTGVLGVDLPAELATQAVTHRSYAYEHGGLPHNERLEFLGDSVLGLVVTEHLFRANPDVAEGELAKMRAATVSQRALASVARELGLGRFVLLGKGEQTTGGADKDSILSDTLEAVFGAVYLSHGLEVARELVMRLVGPTLESAARLGAGLDWKTSLQELTSRLGLGTPVYEVEGVGPDHDRTFTARILVEGVERGTGTGTAKKIAEQVAAQAAFEALSEVEAVQSRA